MSFHEKAVVSQAGPSSYFPFILEKSRHLGKTLVCGGCQGAFYFNGQRDAFPDFVLLNRERPVLARQRGQQEWELVADLAAWTKRSCGGYFGSFGNGSYHL